MERLLIVGNPLPFHIGAYLEKAAQAMGLEVTICDTQSAFAAPIWLRRFTWHLWGKRPPRLSGFGKLVIERCKELRPRWLLATGIAPLEQSTLQAIGRMGIERLNYLTDDPWNPAHRSDWFLAALQEYDLLFSPRRANLEELRKTGGGKVQYLPFAYAPHLHYIPQGYLSTIPALATPEVVFVGGGDKERVEFFSEAIGQGLSPHLYGGYWERFSATRPFAKGHATADKIRELTAAAINICLVRRANRDGHVMRSFEIPACGGVMVAEDTEEHRAIFGRDGEAVLYFSTASEMVAQLRELLSEANLCRRLAENAHALITTGQHTYQERLRTMLDDSYGT